MGSLSQQVVVTIAFLFLWNVAVIRCAPTRTSDAVPFHYTNGGGSVSGSGSLGLDSSNYVAAVASAPAATLPDQFPRNPNYYWSKESGVNGNELLSKQQQQQQQQEHDEFVLPTIYQLRRHWEHNAAVSRNDDDEDDNNKNYYSSSSAAAAAAGDRDEGGGGGGGGNGNDESDELITKPITAAAVSSEEYDSKNPLDEIVRPNNINYNFRNLVYPERDTIEEAGGAQAQQYQYGGAAPNGVVEYYKAVAAKRSPACLRKCMAQGLLHPAQCHSLC